MGIRHACDELRTLSDFDRMQRFERMLDYLRSGSSQAPPVAPAPAEEKEIPSMRDHRRMRLEQLLFSDED